MIDLCEVKHFNNYLSLNLVGQRQIFEHQLWLRRHLLFGYLGGLLLLLLSQLLLHLLWHLTLGWDLVQTRIKVVGRLDGLNLGLANSGADAVRFLGIHLSGIGNELGLSAVGLRVGGVQQLEVLVELVENGS